MESCYLVLYYFYKEKYIITYQNNRAAVDRNEPYGITVDDYRNLFVMDSKNYGIRIFLY